jgi:FERM/RhoGEF/pleckstrin domain protein 2
MTHSLSTPSGVDGSATTNYTRGGGKKLAFRVQMLDDSMTLFQVQVCRFIFGYFILHICDGM